MIITISITTGVPMILGCIASILNIRFAQRYDEEADQFIGGMTICGACSYCCSCGESFKIKEDGADEFVVEYEK